MKSGLAKATIAVLLTMTAALSPAMTQSHKLLGTESNLNQQEPQADDQSKSKHKQGAPAIAVPPIYFEIPSNHNEETQRPGANSKEGQGYDIGTIAAVLAAFFGALSFVAYAYQAYFMRGQLRVAVEQSETTRHALYGLERPYVFVEFDGFQREQVRLKFKYRFVNHGRAPAVVLICRIGEHDIGRSESVAEFDATSDGTKLDGRYEREISELNGIVIPAGKASPDNEGSLNYYGTISPGKPPDSRFLMFLRGGRRLFFTGSIKYTGPIQAMDGVSQPHVTAFAYRVTEHGNRFYKTEYGGNKRNYRT